MDVENMTTHLITCSHIFRTDRLQRKQQKLRTILFCDSFCHYT